MATMKTTSKRNPITGDPVNNSSFPGSTGSKRELRKNAAGTLTNRQNRAINNGIDPETGKIKYKGIPTKGEMRREERSRTRGGSTTTSSTTTSRGRGSSGGDFKNTHVKKSQVKSVNQGIKGRGKKGMSKSCKKLFN